MNQDRVTLNTLFGKVELDLHFTQYYGEFPRTFDFLQDVRTRWAMVRPPAFEHDYWVNLKKHSHRFARQVPKGFDLLVDVPSNSGYHRPYFDAVGARYRNVRHVHLRKDTYVNSAPENIDELRKHTQIYSHGRELPLTRIRRVLIVDDVFASGTLMTVVIEKLFGFDLRPDATIFAACPLRVRMNACPRSPEPRLTESTPVA